MKKRWSALGITKTESTFDSDIANASKAPIDAVPEPGKDYHPHFPPLKKYDPKDWKTTTPSPSVANPHAPAGGTLRLAIRQFPPTLRTEGPNSSLQVLNQLHSLVYESLLNFDMTLKDYVPSLADSWKIMPDKKTFYFHIDPAARWADGRPVTADDVKATLEHMQNPGCSEYASIWSERFKSAQIIDEYTVKITAKKALWSNFNLIALTFIYPAAYIRMDANTYLHDWDWKLPPGSGPYALDPKDVVQGVSITIHRRKNWWAGNKPWNRGTYNFDTIRWNVIRKQEIMYQKFLKHEIDIYQIAQALKWVKILPKATPVERGWVQIRKIYTLNPPGFSGYAFNMRVPPFNDRDVRLAFCYLFNRKELFDKFLFNQYEYVDSYYPDQPWARPGHHPIHFDPEKARALLAKAGWKHRDSQGYLMNADRTRFPTLELDNDSGPQMARLYELYIHDLWNQAGIKVNLVNISRPAFLKKMWDYQFRIAFTGWTASLFPQPEGMWSSKFADLPQKANICGFKDPEVDRLIQEYKHEFDQSKREKILQRIDAILYRAHPYALAWTAPYFRIAYWDLYGHPPEYASRFGEDILNVIQYWWYSVPRAKKTRRNMNRDLPNYPDKPNHQSDDIEIKYWLTHKYPRPRKGD